MHIDQLKSVYFIGIGGSGMSALARYFNSLGVKVAGYDKTSTSLTELRFLPDSSFIAKNVHFSRSMNADRQS